MCLLVVIVDLFCPNTSFTHAFHLPASGLGLERRLLGYFLAYTISIVRFISFIAFHTFQILMSDLDYSDSDDSHRGHRGRSQSDTEDESMVMMQMMVTGLRTMLRALESPPFFSFVLPTNLDRWWRSARPVLLPWPW